MRCVSTLNFEPRTLTTGRALSPKKFFFVCLYKAVSRLYWRDFFKSLGLHWLDFDVAFAYSYNNAFLLFNFCVGSPAATSLGLYLITSMPFCGRWPPLLQSNLRSGGRVRWVKMCKAQKENACLLVLNTLLVTRNKTFRRYFVVAHRTKERTKSI